MWLVGFFYHYDAKCKQMLCELNKLTFLASLPSFTSSSSFFSDLGVSSFFFSAFFVLKNGLSRYHVSFRKLESMRTDKLLFTKVKLLGTSRNSVEFTSLQPIQFSFLFCLVDYCSVLLDFEIYKKLNQ